MKHPNTSGEPAPDPRLTRHSFTTQLMLLAFVTVGIIVANMLVAAHASVHHTSEIAVRAAEKHTHAELDRFMTPVQLQLLTLRGMAARGQLDIDNAEALNHILIPILSAQSAATSAVIATDDGREHMILKTDDGWLNRRINRQLEPRATHWTRLSPEGSVLESYDKDLDYRSSDRPWYQRAAAAPVGEIVWTDFYTLFTSRQPGVSAATRVQTPKGILTIDLDLKVLQISAFTTSLQVASRGVVAIATDDGKVIGLPHDPRYLDPKAQTQYTLKPLTEIGHPALIEALKTANDGTDIRRILVGSQAWWVTSEPAGPDHLNMHVLVAIPEADFLEPLRAQQFAATLVALIGLLVGVALFWRTNRAVSNHVANDAVQIGPYRLGAFIQSTPRSAVRHAEHVSLRIPVTFKVFKANSEDAAIALESYGVKLTAIQDHHLQLPIDYGSTINGEFYMAFPGSWDHTLKSLNVPLPAARACDITLDVIAGLRVLHHAGLMHRNLAPESILLNDQDQVTLTNYCVASDFVDASEGAGFVAPECIEAPERADHAADVYGVAALLYFMLEGRPAYAGNSSTTILMKQLTEDPIPMSSQTPTELANLVFDALTRRAQRRITLDVLEQRLREFRDAL